MSTHATIGKFNSNNTVTGIYCHFDGYLSYVGKKLLEFYNTNDAVDSLLANGDMSFLEDTTDDCVFYHRDRDEDWEAVHPRTYSSKDEYRRKAELYAYLFEDGKWYYRREGEDFSVLTMEDCEEKY